MGKDSSGFFRGTSGDLGNAELGGIFAGAREVHGFPLVLHEGRQGKHMPNHNNYIAGRSVFYGSMHDAQEVLTEYGGTGIWYERSKREVIDVGRVIGSFVDRDTGIGEPTTRLTIHYSENGAHIVPSNPKPKRSK